MCESFELKATGDKRMLVKRTVCYFMTTSVGKQAVLDNIDATIGPATQGDTPYEVRRFYTDNYPALDRFDRLWYEMKFLSHPHDWISYFTWSFIHSAVINARAAWCAVQKRRVPLWDFLGLLVSDFVASHDLNQ